MNAELSADASGEFADSGPSRDLTGGRRFLPLNPPFATYLILFLFLATCGPAVAQNMFFLEFGMPQPRAVGLLEAQGFQLEEITGMFTEMVNCLDGIVDWVQLVPSPFGDEVLGWYAICKLDQEGDDTDEHPSEMFDELIRLHGPDYLEIDSLRIWELPRDNYVLAYTFETYCRWYIVVYGDHRFEELFSIWGLQ